MNHQNIEGLYNKEMNHQNTKDLFKRSVGILLIKDQLVCLARVELPRNHLSQGHWTGVLAVLNGRELFLKVRTCWRIPSAGCDQRAQRNHRT